MKIAVFSTGKYSSIFSAAFLIRLLRKQVGQEVIGLTLSRIESRVVANISRSKCEAIEGQKHRSSIDISDIDKKIISELKTYAGLDFNHENYKNIKNSIMQALTTQKITHLITNPGGDPIKRILYSVCQTMGIKCYFIRRSNFEAMTVGVIVNGENDQWLEIPETGYQKNECRKEWVKNYLDRAQSGKVEKQYDPKLRKTFLSLLFNILIRFQHLRKKKKWALNAVSHVSWAQKKIERRNRRQNKTLYSSLPTSPYHFLPLQWPFESNLSVLGAKYYDQYNTIQEILLLIGSTEKLVIKEHPNRLGTMDHSKLKKLKNEHKNFILVDPTTNPSSKIIAGCDKVFSITSTVGFEAAYVGKTVVLLGDRFYQRFTNHIDAPTDKLSKSPELQDLKKEIIEFTAHRLTSGYMAIASSSRDLYSLRKVYSLSLTLRELLSHEK